MSPVPNAVPANATASLPKARMIDPRGHRFGAAVSGVLLVAAFLLNAPIGVAIALASIGISAAFGLRWSIYGVVWRRIVSAMRLGPVEPEHEYPPRFAQTLGSVALILSLVAFLAGTPALGWLLALAVAGLQGLLAVTGYCLGCRLYFLRWWVPDLVTRIWTRNRPALVSGASSQINFR
jgi:Zn-dependent protease